ncbi:glycoside hydrolase family 88 protein [Emticicia sp. TH156]|uniref:glycoside hydrolase family 88/105 protein n=1 Tax=Emticicia sp. TH156 TaxID=2067454 RepID=UPI000C778F49|nr:glycoside hydrolase family 88 protein [Emticicia sp. TH156]PLK44072.1 family 88 glycosyl hydrolase [Emticicia sp. TH156]
MKKIISALTIIFLLARFCAFAQSLPKNQDILKTINLANEYFMLRWPDVSKPIAGPDKTRPSNIWTRGVYYEGLMALYKIDPQKRYYDYAVAWGDAHKWGLRNGIATRNADDQCCGQTYIDLYVIDPKPERIRDIKASIDSMLNNPKKDDWWWVDALQMAMPVFAQLGAIYEDNRYFEKMHELYLYTKTRHGEKGLYNEADGLWWRDKDFDPPYATPAGKSCYWARGNGWVVAALVRVLDILPKDAPHRDEYLKTYLEMMNALLPLQRTDGFWNASLADPNDFGGKELTGTSLFLYGMAWGINKGILDRRKFYPPMAKATHAIMNNCVHPNGFLGYVQGTGKEPKDGQPVSYDKVPDYEDFGLGCFMLALTEVYKIKR